MAINSRLLACKAEIGQALYYVKLALRVDPYFHVFSSNQADANTGSQNPLYSNHFN
jgi:hypothetical protein